jgi:protein-tyrosine-phosphatase
MAEGLLRRAIAGRNGLRVLSAGVGAQEGQPPSAHAVGVMRELGIDIASTHSRMLTAELVDEASYIFGMTRGHVDSITLLHPHAAEKTFWCANSMTRSSRSRRIFRIRLAAHMNCIDSVATRLNRAFLP